MKWWWGLDESQLCLAQLSVCVWLSVGEDLGFVFKFILVDFSVFSSPFV